MRLQEPHARAAPLQQPQVTVPSGMHERRHPPPAAFDVQDQGSVGFVPVPGPVPVILIVIQQLAGGCIERNGRVRIEVVAGTPVAGPRAAVADAPKADVQRGIVGAGNPDRPAAGLPRVGRPRLAARFARGGDRVTAPELAAAHGVQRRDEPPDAELATRSADHDHPVHHQGGHRDVVGAAVVRDRAVPYERGRLPHRAPRRGHPACRRTPCRRTGRRRDWWNVAVEDPRAENARSATADRPSPRGARSPAPRSSRTSSGH